MSFSPSLPPRFLLPSWSSRELHRLARISQSESFLSWPEACSAQQTHRASNRLYSKHLGTHRLPDTAAGSTVDPSTERAEFNDESTRKPEWKARFKSQLVESFGKKTSANSKLVKINCASSREVRNVALAEDGFRRKGPTVKRLDLKSLKSEQGLRPPTSIDPPSPKLTSSSFKIKTNSSIACHPQNLPGKSHPGVSIRQSPPVSLFEELFPTEYRRESQAAEDKKSEFAELEDLGFPAFQDSMFASVSAHPGHYSDVSKQHEQHSPQQKTFDRSVEPNVVVLTIGGLSPSLSRSDFERMIPRGENVKQWHSSEEVFYVIPGRSWKSMEPKPFYHLVFTNVAMAQAYRAHLKYVHTLAKQYAPNGQSTEDIPKPGSYVRGENIGRLLHDYALCPPSQELKMNLTMIPESHSALYELLETKGYPELENVSEFPKGRRSVVVWIEGLGGVSGHGVTVPDVLRRDSRIRGQLWGAVRPGGDMVALAVEDMGNMSWEDWEAWRKGVKRWKSSVDTKPGAVIEQEPHASVSAISGARTLDAYSQNERPLATASDTMPFDETQHGSMANNGPDSCYGSAEEDFVTASGLAMRDSSLSHRLLRRPQRWLLSFADETEARRFVRRWHRRELPSSLRESEGGEMRAEFAW